MRNEATVSKRGDSLAVRIPQGIAKEAGISEDDYELSELVSQITPQNRHGETDWR